jgi:hypothetical protein
MLKKKCIKPECEKAEGQETHVSESEVLCEFSDLLLCSDTKEQGRT